MHVNRQANAGTNATKKHALFARFKKLAAFRNALKQREKKCINPNDQKK
jgi:hypothetical protein